MKKGQIFVSLKRKEIVTRSTTQMPSHRINLRTSTSGREDELVRDFLSRTRLEVPSGHNLVILREPQIGANIPDLLLLVWKSSLLRARAKVGALSKKHWTILFYLAQHGPTELDLLSHAIHRDAKIDLWHLSDLNWVTSHRNRWNARSLKDLIAVADVIAIEAKLQRPREALLQAFANTWYASQSYVLLPARTTKTGPLLPVARSFNVGIWLHSDGPEAKVAVRPRRLSAHRSYVGWQLNEWLVAHASTIGA